MIVDSNGRIWGRGYNANGVLSTNGSYNNNHTYYICSNTYDTNCGTPAGAVSNYWIKKTDGAAEAGGETGFDSVFVNVYTACALKAGVGFCWGYNNSYGSVGNNNSSSYEYYFRKLAVDGSTTYSEGISEMWPAGNAYYNLDAWCLLKRGARYCWGYNGQNQLGINSTTNYIYPYKWNGDNGGYNYSPSYYRNLNYTTLVPNMYGMCAISVNGYNYCWGNWTGYYYWGSSDSTTRAIPYEQTSASFVVRGQDRSANYPVDSVYSAG